MTSALSLKIKFKSIDNNKKHASTNQWMESEKVTAMFRETNSE